MTSKESDKGVLLSLAGKVALITGGSRGIGAATVRLFVEAGAQVVFNYRSARKEAEQLAAECGGAGRCVAVHRELKIPAHGRELVADAVRTFGRLDCVVVNHGIWPPEDAPIESMTDAQWHQTMHVNLDSVFGTVQASVAQMKKQGRPADGSATGHVVLISSTAGQRGEAMHSDYAATKGAIISFTKSLSSELIREGIHVNSVAPGWVDTDMSAATLRDPEKSQRVFSGIPAGRAATAYEDRGAGAVPVHAAGGLHQRRDLQCERRLGAGRLSCASGARGRRIPGPHLRESGKWSAEDERFPCYGRDGVSDGLAARVSAERGAGVGGHFE